jgi:hypothetical protein
MKTELQQKMQKWANAVYDSAYKDYRQNYGYTIEKSEFRADREKTAYMDGATAMYSELSPLIEWISVEDEMPTPENWVLTKRPSEEDDIPYIGEWEYNIDILSVISGKWMSGLNPTHWRLIELK